MNTRGPAFKACLKVGGKTIRLGDVVRITEPHSMSNEVVPGCYLEHHFRPGEHYQVVALARTDEGRPLVWVRVGALTMLVDADKIEPL